MNSAFCVIIELFDILNFPKNVMHFYSQPSNESDWLMLPIGYCDQMAPKRSNLVAAIVDN